MKNHCIQNYNENCLIENSVVILPKLRKAKGPHNLLLIWLPEKKNIHSSLEIYSGIIFQLPLISTPCFYKIVKFIHFSKIWNFFPILDLHFFLILRRNEAKIEAKCRIRFKKMITMSCETCRTALFHVPLKKWKPGNENAVSEFRSSKTAQGWMLPVWWVVLPYLILVSVCKFELFSFD